MLLISKKAIANKVIVGCSQTTARTILISSFLKWHKIYLFSNKQIKKDIEIYRIEIPLKEYKEEEFALKRHILLRKCIPYNIRRIIRNELA